MPSSTVSLEPLSSPSPSPPPPEEHNTASSNHSGAAGLDSGSELSELTEDEQEENRENGKKSNTVRTSSRDSRRRGGLVPAPMWDWAYRKGDWRTRLLEEEEEEEPSRPAEAMEEEEDDDDQGPRADPGKHAQGVRGDAPSDDDGEEDGEEDNDLRDRDDEDETTLPTNRDRVADDHESEDEVEDEDEDDAEAAGSAVPSQAPSRKGRGSPDLTDDENVDEEEVDEGDAPAVESDVDDDAGAAVTVDPPAHVDSTLPIPDDTAVLMELDETAPAPSAVAPITAAAAGSSIMAGSTVVDPPSPSPSSSTSASGSPSSSRSPSPEPEHDTLSDREPEAETEPKASASRSSRRNKKKAKSSRSRKSKVDAAPDHDIEMDADPDPAAEPDADDGDVADVEKSEADSPEMELESELQPAHRAEALDVLATIELKFALLRERLYVEKMDNLAWEEALVADGTHPEMLHLHSELLQRRDKRLELAARRRDYEIANVTKRRRLDEDGVWSWWKYERDDLQTEMISETNRKRRKLERERRALERPPPERRIPVPPQVIDVPPSLHDIVKKYPIGAASIHSQSSRHKGRVSPSALAYPQLSTLSPTDAARDLEFLFQHRRSLGGVEINRPIMPTGHGGPAPANLYDYQMNMAVLDGSGTGNRFAAQPPAFPQQAHHYAQVQGPPPMMQGFPGPGRLPHHNSAPAGPIPHLHPSQIQIEQEMIQIHRPDSRSAQSVPSMQHYATMGPIPGPGNLMRRSITPVPVQTLNNGSGPGMPIGMGSSPMPPGFVSSKPNGWAGVGPPGPSSLSGGVKEPRRPSSVADARDREKDRDRYAESLKGRPDRERESDRDREHQRDREREQDRGFQMSNVQIMQQRHSGHQHPHAHVHPVPGQAPHHHAAPHHHHHHHHHVLHHHHPQQPNGPVAQAPSMSGLPPGVGVGPGPIPSPRPLRDNDPRRPHSGAPPEILEHPSGPSRHTAPSPRGPSQWKGSDEPPPMDLSRDLSRDRGRPPLGPPHNGPHDRMMTSFMVTTPTQSMQGSFIGSPRIGSVGSALPGPNSVGPSRRGSWSTPDDGNLPRPVSSASSGHPPSGHSQNSSNRIPVSRRPRTPVSQANTGPWGSPTHATPAEYGLPPNSPRNNGVPPRAMSPITMPSVFPGPMRSPTRPSQQPLTVPQLPPPPTLTSTHPSPLRPTSPPKNGSPSLKAFGRIPNSPGLPKAPAPRLVAALHPSEQHVSSNQGMPVAAGTAINVVNIRTSSPVPLFPSSHSSQSHSSRLSNGGMPDAPHLSGGPVGPKIVPVDGS